MSRYQEAGFPYVVARHGDRHSERAVGFYFLPFVKCPVLYCVFFLTLSPTGRNASPRTV